MVASFSPPFSSAVRLIERIRSDGYAVLPPDQVAELSGVALAELEALKPYWNELLADPYLKDGGRYRQRRHSCFIADSTRNELQQTPHRAHWQSLTYNALHGGMLRWFEPIDPAMIAAPAWSKLLLSLAGVCSGLKGEQPWWLEAHTFRIDTTDGIGRPTPEGAHRDGVDFVAVLLVGREAVKGGETRVFEADGPNGQRFTLTAPWSLLFLDDQRMIHESTPIQPVGDAGHRDTLVLTYRAKAFQGES